MTGAGGRAGTAPAVFLERQSYRRRRLMDVARLLPILGAALFAVPLLWPRAPRDTPTPAEAQGMPMSDAIFYIFVVWAVLIGLSVLFSLGVRRWGGDDDTEQETG